MPDRVVVLLLREWRQAERDLAALPKSARPRERAELHRRVDSLRIAYHEASRALAELYASELEVGPLDAETLGPEEARFAISRSTIRATFGN